MGLVLQDDGWRIPDENKPDRRIFDRLVEQFGIEPERTVFIGDSPVNIDAGCAAEFASIPAEPHSIDYLEPPSEGFFHPNRPRA
jgi:FMN phosphatase YigB (HAD superfamily)